MKIKKILKTMGFGLAGLILGAGTGLAAAETVNWRERQNETKPEATRIESSMNYGMNKELYTWLDEMGRDCDYTLYGAIAGATFGTLASFARKRTTSQ